ncbi:GNAT family N-acetyltransferase [Salinarimonas ramus]|uniref:GNAT family N-acetyltransferase n=1 Tax=Salinarimonas ramus TaxID=690164 RepID=UPI0016671680|nr:GNAT family N-acetyltransferase [Salinarimonas ramus]
MPTIRQARAEDLSRIAEIRLGVTENRLADPTAISDQEVFWYLGQGVFLVSEDDAGRPQGFACANPLNGYVWALFVIDPEQGKGHGTALHDAMLASLKNAGHAQAWLATGAGTKAIGFYERRGWRMTGTGLDGQAVLVRAL